MPWLRRLVAGVWPRRNGFDPSSVHVRFVVDKLTPERVFVLVLRFSPVIIIPPMTHAYLHLHVAVTRRTNGQSLGTFQKVGLFCKSGSIGWKGEGRYRAYKGTRRRYRDVAGLEATERRQRRWRQITPFLVTKDWPVINRENANCSFLRPSSPFPGYPYLCRQ